MKRKEKRFLSPFLSQRTLFQSKAFFEGKGITKNSDKGRVNSAPRRRILFLSGRSPFFQRFYEALSQKKVRT